MQNFLKNLRLFLEKIDHYKDNVLFALIRPYWPRSITPNMITYMRIFVGTLLFFLLFFFSIDSKILVVSLFSIGALTDLLDGSVARGLKKVTEFGAMLDPLADRILIIPIAFCSLYSSHKWLLLWFILAEIVNAIVALFYQSNKAYAPNIFGKTRMVLLSIVFIVILIVWPKAPPIFFIYILWISLIFTFLSVFTRILDLNTAGYIKNKTVKKQLKRYEI